MSLFVFKKYPTPIFKPMWPFFAGGVLTFWGISTAADLYMNTDEFINDHRHPRFKDVGGSGH
ncbi:ATPase [Dipodascopsis tothii]|uniref:ATPase n=1 Tax=Dipodascopsis tothii TaxID=44089 RepID=UPI0034CF4908